MLIINNIEYNNLFNIFNGKCCKTDSLVILCTQKSTKEVHTVDFSAILEMIMSLLGGIDLEGVIATITGLLGGLMG